MYYLCVLLCIYIHVISVDALEVFTYHDDSTSCLSKNHINFLNKCYCKPSYVGESCSELIKSNDDCNCHTLDIDNPAWRHPHGYRCEMLCRSNPQVGVPKAIKSEWVYNQNVKQLHASKNDMKSLFTENFKQTRLHEHIEDMREGFQNFKYLENQQLGNVLEVGSGAYPQIYHMMNLTNVSATKITLLDPLAKEYVRMVPNCLYTMNKLKATKYQGEQPVKIIDETLEEFSNYNSVTSPSQMYDTIISVDVLPYAQDGLAYLTSLYRLLKPNGMLIFYERWFDNPGVSSKCRLVGFTTNLIQISRTVLDHFLSHYTVEPWFSSKQTKGQVRRSKDDCKWLDDETGYFVVAKKKA
jgi:2-polyprenyl-3-methyl-5-hydroxy-6-metoxy-1,4-benzoquinol methylase